MSLKEFIESFNQALLTERPKEQEGYLKKSKDILLELILSEELDSYFTDYMSQKSVSDCNTF